MMKAVSGKFHPIFQWFYFDAVEALTEGLPLSPAEVAPQVQPSAWRVPWPTSYYARVTEVEWE